MNKNGAMDKGIFVSVLFLMAFGIIFVYSSSFPVAATKFNGEFYFVSRQIIRVVMGLVALLIFSTIDYRVLEKISPVTFGIGVLLLLLVLVAPDSIAHARKGAKRWLFGVQVSEIARIALIITMAAQLSRIDEKMMQDWKNSLPTFFAAGIVVVLIAIEPNFSTAMLVTVLATAIIFVAGFPKRIMFPAMGLGFVGALAYGLSADYRMKRVTAFLHPEENAAGSAFQAFQGMIGIGHGKIFGTGLGAGEQKFFFLPESHNDFIFSILGEEVGFVGLTILAAIYLFIIYRGFKIASEAPDRFGSLLAFGITLIFASYFLMHSYVNVSLFPTTGVPLPFISYGGMSLVFTAASIGILLNISRHRVYGRNLK